MTLDFMRYDLIACVKIKDQHIDVYRDKWGKFYVRNEGVITQRKLNASEIVRWLASAAHEE